MNEKNDKETRDRMIWLLRMDIAKNLNEGVKHWVKDKLDVEMWNLTINDTNDLIGVIDLIQMNEVSAAFEKANLLDTAVRDVIPKEVWNWMAFVRQEQDKNTEHWARLDDGQKYSIVAPPHKIVEDAKTDIPWYNGDL